MNNVKVGFYVAYPYYFPHFLPISEYFASRGCECLYILSDEQNNDVMEYIAKEAQVSYTFDKTALYDPELTAAFFANRVSDFERVHALKFLLDHGIGTKDIVNLYAAINSVDIYFTESIHQTSRLQKDFPHCAEKVKQVGYSKLDSIFEYSKHKSSFLERYGFDEAKKTILYAPTFFPSSIERMSDSFPEHFEHCNIVIKPHYLTYERSRYKRQRKKLKKWSAYSNCVVVPNTEYNLVPLLVYSDVMVSDESSAMFEFVALDKPVVSNRYYKLRWSYYVFRNKLNKRLDTSKDKYRVSFDTAYSYKETVEHIESALDAPGKLQSERLKVSQQMCGTIDGKVSQRMYDVMHKKIEEKLSR